MGQYLCKPPPAVKHAPSPSSPRKSRVVLVGVGGATCSGKTTLAKILEQILPTSIVIHQDDFWPPQEAIPLHPIHNIPDCDAALGAIDWPRFVAFLRQVKATGKIPPGHQSYDQMGGENEIKIRDEVRVRWSRVFRELEREAGNKGEQVVWGLVDGFLLYWHPEVIELLDARVFLRVPHDVLKQRRYERYGYHTAEGTVWHDPPLYWEQIVYPAFVDAHREVFEGGDIDKGKPGPKVNGLVVIESLEMEMDEVVDRSCKLIRDTL